MENTVRLAREQDLAQMLAIYTPYVLETIVSMEYAPPAPEEFARRFAQRRGVLPWLVCERGGEVTGYAYASRFGERSGYDWSAEVSVYVDRERRAGGAGRALYTALIALLRAQGYHSLYAVIATPNPESEGFHCSMGFARQGLFPGCGRKFGRPVDISYYGMALAEPAQAPPPRKLAQLEPAELRRILTGAGGRSDLA